MTRVPQEAPSGAVQAQVGHVPQRDAGVVETPVSEARADVMMRRRRVEDLLVMRLLQEVVAEVSSLSLSPEPHPQRHSHRAPHMTRSLGFSGFGELRRVPPRRPGGLAPLRRGSPVKASHIRPHTLMQ